jgi:hypothetical protein
VNDEMIAKAEENIAASKLSHVVVRGASSRPCRSMRRRWIA